MEVSAKLPVLFITGASFAAATVMVRESLPLAVPSDAWNWITRLVSSGSSLVLW